ncbi:hypothetical protein AMTR_s00037p00104020 [Amborella trichopoda]|uniref:Uncharacterized protein n=1 Tax=Amborella trichopoda TaxID=13333 RepID=U5CVH2_AMBTC|nr:hypothetical protein AMTR_s00037p00104020 [Amborella trichopoda]
MTASIACPSFFTVTPSSSTDDSLYCRPLLFHCCTFFIKPLQLQQTTQLPSPPLMTPSLPAAILLLTPPATLLNEIQAAVAAARSSSRPKPALPSSSYHQVVA